MPYDRDLSASELNAIENLIDAVGLSAFLEGVSSICGEKATHIATAWQDATLAKQWATVEGAVGCIVPKARGL